MKLWSPFSGGQANVARLAPRKPSLAGLTIGVLDNSKPNAGALMHRVAELLAARTGAAGVRGWSKPSAARPAEILDDIARGADVVLTGSAD
jgi:hypothetical protein